METTIAVGTKLAKNDDGPIGNSTLYKRMVGVLMYLIATRTNLMYVVGLISIFIDSTKDSHWKVGKIIMRYLARTIGYRLWYTHSPYSTLIGYTVIDFCGEYC